MFFSDIMCFFFFFFFSSRRRHTRYWRDWSSDVCSSDLIAPAWRDDNGPLRTREEVALVNELSGPRRGRPRARTSHPQDDGLPAGVPEGAPSGDAPFTGGTPPAPQRPEPSLSLGKITRDWRCLGRKDQTPENGPVDGVHLPSHATC